MSRSRRRIVGAAAAVVAAALLPSAAAAAPDVSLYGLDLESAVDCGTVKTAYGQPWTPYLFGPVRLLDGGRTPTGWLVPYSVEVSGEGLKARHMLPQTFTRPGVQPPNVAPPCVFTGATADGPFEIVITGTVSGGDPQR